MLTIRLRRMGARNAPYYRVVVSDSRQTPTASAVEEIGHYDPRRNPPEVVIDRDRVAYWVARGAQLSPTVTRLVRGVKPSRSAPAAPAPAPAAVEAPVVEAPVVEAAAADAAPAAPAAEPAEAELTVAQLRQSLGELVRLMVDHPDGVDVVEVPQTEGTLFELWTEPDDLGQVIGRQGRTARALRTLLDARAALEDSRYELDICEE